MREWVIKGENDLTTAAHTLKLGRRCPTESVGFHAQQCVEKYLKALLIKLQIEFPKTHDLRILMRRLPSSVHIALAVAEQDELTRFAVATRYPGEDDPIALKEARQALRIARRVRTEIRRLLPRRSLRKR